MTSSIIGIKDLKLPIQISGISGEIQHSVAKVGMQAVSPKKKTPNLDEIIGKSMQDFHIDFQVKNYAGLLTSLQEEIEAENIKLILKFPYFMEKKAPATGARSLMEYHCRLDGETSSDKSLKLCVQVPITTLCPCSRELSKAGAHNQRAEVTLCVKYKDVIRPEELIALVESSASCGLYALLKRPDEKFVTEYAYHNPMFVEDVVRMAAVKAADRPDITWFSAEAESFESIHNHNAYALVESDRL
ncbi:MAG: GTP cyclohydrolase I FolE2 [Deltaproteobacteria bacterium]|nr:MAG: GTP cyclohydrolase I FolE2 [Deltaproteobacteria bacterium]